jgi:hypothetical protein
MNYDQILLERAAMESTIRKTEAHLSLAECELAELTAVLKLAQKNERFTEPTKLLVQSHSTVHDLRVRLGGVTAEREALVMSFDSPAEKFLTNAQRTIQDSRPVFRKTFSFFDFRT